MFQLSEVDLIFRNYINKLEGSVRDSSVTGRVNEFSRVVTTQVHCGVIEFIERVVRGEKVNTHNISYVIEKLKDSVNELEKLKKIIGGKSI